MNLFRSYKLPINPLTKPQGEFAGLVGKSSCKKCYGRGIVGKNVTTGEIVPCRCASAVFKEDMGGLKIKEEPSGSQPN